MPTIWNVNGNNIVSNKKMSSKLTFNVGEKFTGKIIKKDGDKNVTIKLADGWQFTAELDEDVDLNDKTVFKFVVEDTENGKLKLKIIKNNNVVEEVKDKDKILLKFIKSEGLSKEDMPLLKEMIKRDIPLTKENIAKFKEIIYFVDSIKENETEENNFIEKFLISKDIPKESVEGIKIENILKDFMKSFKAMSKEDVLLFLENNIDFDKEKIEGFNKLFKKEDGFKSFIKELNIILKDDVSKEVALKEFKSIESGKENIKNGDNVQNKTISTNTNYGNIDNKSSVVGLIKTIIGNEDNTIEGIMKELVTKEELDTNEFKNIIKKFEGITEGKFIQALEENIEVNKEVIDKSTDAVSDFLKKLENVGKNSTSENVKNNLENIIPKEVLEKGNVEEVISKFIGKEIKLNDSEFEKIVKIINEFEKEKLTSEVKEKIINQPKVVMDNSSKKDEIINSLKEKFTEFKGIAQKGSSEELGSKTYDKLVQFMKSNAGEFKIFNNVSNEYYYLDIPVKVENEEYPCKLIIKDNRKDGKKIDKNNVKLVVSLKTINLGMVDGYIHLNNGSVNVVLKCEEQWVHTLEKSIGNLEKALETVGFNVNTKVERKKEEVNIANCREFFARKENRMIDRMV